MPALTRFPERPSPWSGAHAVRAKALPKRASQPARHSGVRIASSCAPPTTAFPLPHAHLHTLQAAGGQRYRGSLKGLRPRAGAARTSGFQTSHVPVTFSHLDGFPAFFRGHVGSRSSRGGFHVHSQGTRMLASQAYTASHVTERAVCVHSSRSCGHGHGPFWLMFPNLCPLLPKLEASGLGSAVVRA